MDGQLDKIPRDNLLGYLLASSLTKTTGNLCMITPWRSTQREMIMKATKGDRRKQQRDMKNLWKASCLFPTSILCGYLSLFLVYFFPSVSMSLPLRLPCLTGGAGNEFPCFLLLLLLFLPLHNLLYKKTKKRKSEGNNQTKVGNTKETVDHINFSRCLCQFDWLYPVSVTTLLMYFVFCRRQRLGGKMIVPESLSFLDHHPHTDTSRRDISWPRHWIHVCLLYVTLGFE